MDSAFARKYNIPLTTTKPRTVTVAGGGTLSSTAMALNCQFAIQGHTFSTDFRILDLQGSDIILGVNWFTQHNLVTFDFIGWKLTLGIDGKNTPLMTICSTKTRFSSHLTSVAS
jgi:hypothetical protein